MDDLLGADPSAAPAVGTAGSGASGLPAPPGDEARTSTRRRHRVRQQRPGDLTVGWATALGCAWLLAILGLVAVWVSSRTTGLSTWWLGPEARPISPLITALPFVLPVVAALAAFGGARRAPWLGVAAALATACIGLGELGRVTAYGVTQLAIALGTLLVSIASFAGMYRAGTAGATGEGDPAR